ncbi:hypothetical protein HMPREF1279_00700 [Propionibacterium sp. KPL1852]|uniref:Sugar-binding family transcriptional regulator n=2 Tax=Cutibacterium avidum TaxID=33010 RepID=G4CWU8_9ACTN|nr:sugar-binding family transcriptional regulator [Cutibacterium avidum ATCC 25577]ERS23200.1 hypothetical protein HMPREF1301_00998 [Propionibacterium sp. KPL2005]ERS29881.1 hypothetical protein HMPREF1297_00706 [Propionibacterium sp. KPL2000]ERS40958.1 hypothetical protein HMPREF1271_00582 [Propionibacterium sp. KPL1838]ERS68335.1 hypothetical protein HMPREF1279_00700 [Propionibacterium sp. KPL1852]BDY01175.1 transcriptional regulator [Cutibacterium avidum]
MASSIDTDLLAGGGRSRRIQQTGTVVPTLWGLDVAQSNIYGAGESQFCTYVHGKGRGMNELSNDVWTAASMYYMQGETMDAIASHLGTSRSTVSRLLKQARQSGVVRITLSEPTGLRNGLDSTLTRMFGVNTTVVPVKSGTTEIHRLDQVARIAGQMVTDMVEDNSAIGVAWGTTLDAVTHYVVPKDVKGVRVVQMNGSANPTSSGIPYVGSILSRMAAAFGGEVIHFPVPTFFDNATTKAAMWQERSVQAVLKAHRELDLAVFGVGALDSPVPSHVYSAGYITDEEKANLMRSGVVGDVNTVLLKADGAYDVEFNKRATGLAPFQLQRIPRRLCVVAGRAKAVGLLAALRARVATDLVVDDATARAVLDLM